MTDFHIGDRVLATDSGFEYADYVGVTSIEGTIESILSIEYILQDLKVISYDGDLLDCDLENFYKQFDIFYVPKEDCVLVQEREKISLW